jgi:hypothetical protein
MSHWLTNTGKQLLVQGAWDDAAATAIKLGLLAGASTPAAIDTEAEIQDFQFVADLLNATGVDEPVGGWYTRKDLSRTAAALDQANNRANLDTANVTWTAAAAGQTIYGAFWFDTTTGTTDADWKLCGLILFTPVPLNGSDLTLTVTDLVRAT